MYLSNKEGASGVMLGLPSAIFLGTGFIVNDRLFRII
jgi:hypothetical protein